MKTGLSITAALGAALLLTSAARAQNDGPHVASVFDGDYLTVGIGAGYGPSYEGSDDYVLFPAPIVQGNIEGIAITARRGGVALDFIRDAKDAKIGFSLGPVARLRSDRAQRIKDPVVRSLGKLDRAVEVGASAGVTFYGLVSSHDSLTVSSDITWDVAGAHKGMLIQPTVSYFTPLSKGMAINLSLFATHVDDDYANYYFTVTPAGSAVSGLPAFQANGGWKDASATLLFAADFDGDFTNGGFAAFTLGGYSRMLGDAKRTPLTSIRGEPDQWMAGAGLAYTF